MTDETTPLFKDFDVIIAERREKNDTPGPQFKLGGTVWQCKKRLNGAASIALLKVANTNDPDEMYEFMRFVLKGGKTTFESFKALFAGTDPDDEGDYDIEILSDIIIDLVQAYSGRPTQGSSAS